MNCLLANLATFFTRELVNRFECLIYYFWVLDLLILVVLLVLVGTFPTKIT